MSAPAGPPGRAPGPEAPVHYPPIPFPAEVEHNGRRVRRALLAAALLGAILLILLILVFAGLEVGLVNLALALVLALIPVPVYLGLTLWIDRFEPEPRWMIVSTFLWGAAVATFVALVINTIGILVVSSQFGETTGVVFGGSISAPIVEEIAKGAVLFIIFFAKRDELNGVVDGIVYAVVVGLGFATTENVLYYGRGALEEGIEGGIAVFVLRGILTPFLHPLFTAFTGLGLALAAQTQRPGLQWLYALGGLTLAIVFHALWNTAALGGVLVLGVYLLVMLPTLLGMLVIVVLGLARESRLVRTYLAADVQRGVLSPWELEQVSSVRRRISTAWRSLREGGWREWRNCRAYHATASELAFLRYRVHHGLQKEDPRREERLYLERLARLRAPATGASAAS